MKVYFSILFLLISSLSFGQKNTRYPLGEFVPVEQVKDDSVFYIISLSTVFELHANKGYRNIYTSRWYDYEKFDLLFQSSSLASIDSDAMAKPIKCLAVSQKDSLLSLTMNAKLLLLKTHTGPKSVWDLMLERDKELLRDNEELQNALKESKGNDSLLAIMDFVEEVGNMGSSIFKLSHEEENAIDSVFSNLRTFNVENLYANTSRAFRLSIEKKDIIAYLNYVKNIFGKWEYFTLTKQPLKIEANDNKKGIQSATAYSFAVKFEKLREEAELDLELSNENDERKQVEGVDLSYVVKNGEKTINMLRVTSGDYELSPYLHALSARFFDLFYKKKFSTIYKESDDELKLDSSKEQIEMILKLAHSMSNGSAYVFYQHGFRQDPRYGNLISLFYVAQSKSKNFLMVLTYTMDAGKLVGLNFKEVQ